MDPSQLQAIQDVVVGIFVVLLMLSVGLDLSLGALRGVFRRPLAIGAGLVVGYLVVPAAAAGLAALLELGPAARAGLLLCAVAPGGPMGAFLALQARGEVALAAALVLLFNLLNTLLVPVGLDVLGVQTGDLGGGQVWAMARTILLFQVLPLTTGLVLHRMHAARARRLQRWTSGVANALLLIFAVAMIVMQADRIFEVGLRTVVAVQATVTVALVAGWYLAPRARPVRTSLAATSVIHSVSLCVLLASSWFSDPAVLLTVFTYSACMFTTGVVGTRILARGAAA